MRHTQTHTMQKKNRECILSEYLLHSVWDWNLDSPARHIPIDINCYPFGFNICWQIFEFGIVLVGKPTPALIIGQTNRLSLQTCMCETILLWPNVTKYVWTIKTIPTCSFMLMYDKCKTRSKKALTSYWCHGVPPLSVFSQSRPWLCMTQTGRFYGLGSMLSTSSLPPAHDLVHRHNPTMSRHFDVSVW